MTTKARLHTRYPLSTIILYNGTTLLHFIAGGIILFHTNHFWGKFGIALGLVYILMSLVEMYVLKKMLNLYSVKSGNDEVLRLQEWRLFGQAGQGSGSIKCPGNGPGL